MSATMTPAATENDQHQPGYWGWTVNFWSAPPGQPCDKAAGLDGELEIVTSTFATSPSDVKIPTGTVLIVRNLSFPITSPVAIVWAYKAVTIDLDSGSTTISTFTPDSMDGEFSGVGTDSRTNATVTVSGMFNARRCEAGG